VGTLISGSIPLAFTLSPAKLKMVSVYGTGLLLGAAICIVIPEGVDALYKEKTDKETAGRHGSEVRSVGLALVAGFVLM
jgi:zinc transporter 9